MAYQSDTQALELIDRHGAALERYVRLLLAMRETGAPDRPGAWMSRVASNLVISGARRRQTAQRRADDLAVRGWMPPVDELIVRREQDAAMQAALATARDADRTALVMAATGFGVREIAHHIGRSEAATRTLLCRARGRVRRQLVAMDFHD
jgi:DNA-directed RNA polymerase specialized sigma24 family protein